MFSDSDIVDQMVKSFKNSQIRLSIRAQEKDRLNQTFNYSDPMKDEMCHSPPPFRMREGIATNHVSSIFQGHRPVPRLWLIMGWADRPLDSSAGAQASRKTEEDAINVNDVDESLDDNQNSLLPCPAPTRLPSPTLSDTSCSSSSSLPSPSTPIHPSVEIMDSKGQTDYGDDDEATDIEEDMIQPKVEKIGDLKRIKHFDHDITPRSTCRVLSMGQVLERQALSTSFAGFARRRAPLQKERSWRDNGLDIQTARPLIFDEDEEEVD